jgi:hypothetical protein
MGRVDLMIFAVVFLFLLVVRALFALFEGFLLLKLLVSEKQRLQLNKKRQSSYYWKQPNM